MSCKFKVGEKVRIKEPDPWLSCKGMKVGDVLTVARVLPSRFFTDATLLVFEELLQASPGHERFSERFELVEQPVPEVLRDFRLLGSSGSVSNAHKFGTVEEATDHARRNFNRDTVFEVAEVVSVGKFKVTHAVEAI